jgi:phytoene synthase
MDETAVELCAETVRRFDRPRYLTSLFAPRAARPALWAIYALGVELARAREMREEIAREIRLQWWRDRIEAIFAGAPQEPPTARALADAVREHSLARGRFDALIEAEGEEFAAILAELALEVLGATDAVSLEAGRLVALNRRDAARRLNPDRRALPVLLPRTGGRVTLPLRLAFAALTRRW